MAVSNTPWSKFTAADYSVDQWHRACIVHDHDGPPTSKDQCKLPVREPDGTLNKNGVHSALAALNGARGGVKLSVGDKIAARKALAGYYKQIGEKIPKPKVPAFLKHEEDPIRLNSFLAGFGIHREESAIQKVLRHSGIKGMKWGIRRNRGSDGTVSSAVKEGHVEVTETGHHGGGSGHIAVDAERFAKTREKPLHALSDREIKEVNNRAEMVKKYNDLFNDPNRELAQKVQALQLEKSYRQLHAELHPSALAKVVKLVKAAAPLFGTYKAISKHPSVKIFNKFLNDEMAKAFQASVSSNSSSSSKSSKSSSGSAHQQPFVSTPSHPKTTWQAHVTNVRRTPRPSPVLMPGSVHNITSLPPKHP